MNAKKRFLFFNLTHVILYAVVLFSCKKDNALANQYENIPQVSVNIYLNLDQPSNFNLSVVGGCVYIEGGSKGIIVCRTIDDFVAFERHSPYRSDEPCSIVTIDSNNTFFGNEGCDNVKYSLVDGSVVSGNSSVPLLQYQCTITNEIVHIQN